MRRTITPALLLLLSLGGPSYPQSSSLLPAGPSVVRIESAGSSSVHALVPLAADSDYTIAIIPATGEPSIFRISTRAIPGPPPAPPAPVPTSESVPPSAELIPQPAVPPVSGKLYATLIYAPNERSTAALRTSAIADRLAAIGVTWHAFEDGARRIGPDGNPSRKSIVEEIGLADRYARAGSPALFVQDAAGRVLRNKDGTEAMTGVFAPAPADPNEVVSILKAIKGAP